MKKQTPITVKELVNLKNQVKTEVDTFHQKLHKEKLLPVEKLFTRQECKLKVGKVYERTDIKRKRKFSRFVVYLIAPIYSHTKGEPYSHVFVRVAGWWLDQNNTPTEFADMFYSDTWKLSENQTARPHPNVKKKRK